MKSPILARLLILTRKRSILVALSIIIAIALMSGASDIISKHDPYRIDLANKLTPPSAEHPMGTDQLGRDLFSRILYGGRYTLLLSASAIALAILIGVIVGTLSGYYGGWVDMGIQRVVDILMAFPTIILAITLAAFIGSKPETLVIAVGIAESPFMIRVIRAAVLGVRSLPYIEAVKLMGYGDLYIITRHVVPNILYVIIPQATLQIGSAILVIAALGFLGIGIRPPIPEWGSMLNEARTYLMDYPHLLLFPGLMIFISIVCFNIIGEGLREIMDPRTRMMFRAGVRGSLGLQRGGSIGRHP
jgi:peptide/nickel transport system permease protein